uniref:Uncharacterized protein n=1 Tax=Micrurus lemniscatus lemniscatus TaxID=129467 RepID=A0A2D4J214_MICLE
MDLKKLLRMNLKRDCKSSRNRKKQTGCQNKLEIKMKRAEAKDNKDNILRKKFDLNLEISETDMLNNVKGQRETDLKKIKRKLKEYTETLYSQSVNIQYTLENIPYLQEPLVLHSEVRSALWSLSSQMATGIDKMPTEI